MAHKITITRHGGPSVLRVEPIAEAEPGPGEVAVAVAFAGVNWADVMMRMGLYPEAPKPPFTPGYEIAGRIEEVGEGVEGLRKDDRVLAGTRFGGYTTHSVVQAAQVSKLPRSLSLEEAAAVPVNYLTAHAALVGQGKVRKGDKVLVHGGAGGVGLAAIGIAKRLGCSVHATAGGPEKCRFLEDLGVAAIDHMAGSWRTALLDRAGRMDLVLDPVGGENLHESRRVLAPFGRVVSYGLSQAVTGRRRNPIAALGALRRMRADVVGLMMRNTGISGLNLLTLWRDKPDVKESLEWCAREMVRGRLARPRIDSVFPLAEAGKAHEHLQERRNIGKVLLAI